MLKLGIETPCSTSRYRRYVQPRPWLRCRLNASALRAGRPTYSASSALSEALVSGLRAVVTTNNKGVRDERTSFDWYRFAWSLEASAGHGTDLAGRGFGLRQRCR